MNVGAPKKALGGFLECGEPWGLGWRSGVDEGGREESGEQEDDRPQDRINSKVHAAVPPNCASARSRQWKLEPRARECRCRKMAAPARSGWGKHLGYPEQEMGLYRSSPLAGETRRIRWTSLPCLRRVFRLRLMEPRSPWCPLELSSQSSSPWFTPQYRPAAVITLLSL